ncbi:hypothetical protein BDV29DRAFT_183938 [Aspergillus leporis]|jgi:2-haloacid dehalogenase|uniref:Uncharacterized protein n=1 Tax=Aspergillus leporis TaxID=41062 RepID=A0A5N5WJV5_9EURO|nr:hypothetical protein BDV29DRAFT_183938 [Aspergillus leporis]
MVRELKEASKRALYDPHKRIPAETRARVSRMTLQDWLATTEDWGKPYSQFTSNFDTSHSFISVNLHNYMALFKLLQQQQVVFYSQPARNGIFLFAGTSFIHGLIPYKV